MGPGGAAQAGPRDNAPISGGGARNLRPGRGTWTHHCVPGHWGRVLSGVGPPAPEAVAQLARAKGATNEQVARLQADNRELAEELARVKLESVDKVAALAAQVEQLTLTVAKLQPT